MNIMNHLIEKYNVPAPRYTSYPTVPYWDSKVPSQQQWRQSVQSTFASGNAADGISLYIHLPFCESLCTYCGCNTRITVNHNVEMPYINALLKEWSLYLDLFKTKPAIKELHLGGGTPTFFSPAHLRQLISGVLSGAALCSDAELSFEAHPANTTAEHLQTLYSLGFRRISLGIQDFDPKVQQVINRVQRVEDIERVTAQARATGYTSVNYDLIYGLPFQTAESMISTIGRTVALHPDRIAFYSYAHVPWIKPGQRMFTEADLPSGNAKRLLYELGRDALENAGYTEIGMDHFALPDDPLCRAEKQKTLHRNFMGYTVCHTKLLIGLGASAISDSWNGFVQNEKKVEDYYKKIEQGLFPFFKGHILSAEDLVLRKHILNIMCRQETSWEKEEEQCNALHDGIRRLKEAEADGLVSIRPFHLWVLPEGRPFLRNICMALDAKLWAHQPAAQLFSKTI